MDPTRRAGTAPGSPESATGGKAFAARWAKLAATAGPADLAGDRVRLRTFEAEDVAFVRDAVNDRRVWRRLGGQFTPTNLVNEQKYFGEASRNDSVVQFVVADGEERVGLVELESIEWDRSRAEAAF